MIWHNNSSGEYARTNLNSICECDAEVMIAVEVEIDGGEDSRLFALISGSSIGVMLIVGYQSLQWVLNPTTKSWRRGC